MSAKLQSNVGYIYLAPALAAGCITVLKRASAAGQADSSPNVTVTVPTPAMSTTMWAPPSE